MIAQLLEGIPAKFYVCIAKFGGLETLEFITKTFPRFQYGKKSYISSIMLKERANLFIFPSKPEKKKKKLTHSKKKKPNLNHYI